MWTEKQCVNSLHYSAGCLSNPNTLGWQVCSWPGTHWQCLLWKKRGKKWWSTFVLKYFSSRVLPVSKVTLPLNKAWYCNVMVHRRCSTLPTHLMMWKVISMWAQVTKSAFTSKPISSKCCHYRKLWTLVKYSLQSTFQYWCGQCS